MPLAFRAVEDRDALCVCAVIDVADLLTAVGEFDYAVFADSGPAHIAKLFATPGVAVYTSAPGDVLQGRFRNLARWSVPFEGPHCRAPCGLAKLRERADGADGCMGSLGVGLADLPRTPRGRQPAIVDRLVHDPVPCVAGLAASPEPLVQFVRADLEQRIAASQGR